MEEIVKQMKEAQLKKEKEKAQFIQQIEEAEREKEIAREKEGRRLF
jgi:hypothetical protein